ncbi:MAG TPA: helix-turn-helix transcriptional regulator [Propioniciclava sp.]|uniref:helix-turn-helix transcriptional regulator n=3 Tax=Propioniciclava sp. TaxID=2038686 RepID=UPI002BC8142F|nr:helix-turn-helix transcriptional regulator [Propioniciclava sp.]HRL80814.1 helix-turn-helix transcriptional regulator [Propioniciclava sp.]
MLQIDRAGMAEFLRGRRSVLQPEDVGLIRGQRRRTDGLRREEVALLCHMSTDYYARLERGTGPTPSEQMVAAIAQGLHLSLAERDHLFRLAGHHPPTLGESSDHITPGMLRIFDRLQDTPAEIVTELGETLRQTPLGVALTGDLTRFTGPSRAIGYRWFDDPASRSHYPAQDREFLGRLWVSGMRQVLALRGRPSRAAELVDGLLGVNAEFTGLWERQEVGLRPRGAKHFAHPELGAMELECQTLIDPASTHTLLVYTAAPGSESYEKLELLGVIGQQSLR